MDNTQINEIESAIVFFDGYLSLWSEKLNHQAFLKELIEFCFVNHLVEDLHEISFTAKYITGLHRVLIDAGKNPDVTDTTSIEHDLELNLQKVIDRLDALLANAQENLKNPYAEMKALNQDAFKQLFALLVDLDHLKQYFNLLMREAESAEKE